MNALNLAIKDALDANGNAKEANKAYLEFIKANFIVPVEQNSEDDQPKVLFFKNRSIPFFLRSPRCIILMPGLAI